MSTNVPSIQWINGLPVLPTEAAILAGVQADINTAFGGALNPGLTTPQGQIAQSETAIIGDKNAQIAYVVNQIDPANATGKWQDAIGALYFVQRIQAAGTLVACTCVGAVGTIIPQGSLAQDTSGYIYASTTAVTIPASGSVTINFQNQQTGPIPCAAGSLNTIYARVPGWDTVTNPAAGSLGNAVETPAAFEARRQQSVAQNSVNALQSVLAAVLNVPNVIDAAAFSNDSGSPVLVGSTNYSVPAHSLLLSVAGGSATAVAQAIWSKKPPGCGYAGNTSQVVLDTSPQYTPNFPSYTVTWLQPTATPVYVSVTIVPNPLLPANIAALIQAAVIAAFTGTDGGLKARINQTLYAGRFYAGIQAISPYVSILSVYVGTSASPTLTSVTFGYDQLPTLSSANIAVFG